MGLRPAPPPAPIPTRLRAGDAGELRAGDLTLVPGTGIIVAESGDRRFVINGPAPRPRVASHLFLPGTLAVGQVATFDNPDPVTGVTLTALEVNLGTAPSGADPDNNLTLRVSGSEDGQVDLPLSSDSTYHSIDNITDDDICGASTLVEDNASAQLVRCAAQLVEASQTMVATGVRLVQGASLPPSYEPGGPNKRFMLLTEDRTTLIAQTIATDDPWLPRAGGVTPRRWWLPFPEAVTIEQGTRLWVCFESDAIPDSNDDRTTLMGTASPNLIGTSETRAGGRLQMLRIDSGDDASSFLATSPQDGVIEYTGLGAWGMALTGGPSFAVLRGATITVEIIEEGTAPVAGGADANVSFSWGIE